MQDTQQIYFVLIPVYKETVYTTADNIFNHMFEQD